MIIEIALVIIIVIIVLTEFIKYVMPSAPQRIRGGCTCPACIKKFSASKSTSMFRERFSDPLIFKKTYDENDLFKYDMDKETRLRYWH